MIAHNGYSSKVALKLLIGGRTLALSHVGSSRFVVRDVCDPQPPGDAELVIEVNDSTDTYKVFLPFGLAAAGELVEYI